MSAKVARLVCALLLVGTGALVAPAAADVIISNYPPANDSTFSIIDDGQAHAAGRHRNTR